MKVQTRPTLEQKMMPIKNEQFRTIKRTWPIKQKRCYSWSENFSRKNDSVSYLKTFRIIFNEMSISLHIPCWWYLSCLQTYSETFFNIYFHESLKCFSDIFVQGRSNGQKEPSEVFCKKWCSLKCRKSHRKTHVPESLF